jgi:nitroreductase
MRAMTGQPALEPDLFAAMSSQRAMRRLKPDPVPEEHIRKLIWAATQAPNGGNVQPYRFLVVRDPAKKRGLQEIYAKQWAEYTKVEPNDARVATAEGRAALEKQYAAGNYLAAHLHEVPVIIVACGFLLPVNSGIASGSSIYPAIQNLMLAARSLGLGTVMTTLHRHDEGAVRELLGIPENANTAALIPVGYPMGRFGPLRRKPVEEVTYFDYWGNKP